MRRCHLPQKGYPVQNNTVPLSGAHLQFSPSTVCSDLDADSDLNFSVKITKPFNTKNLLSTMKKVLKIIDSLSKEYPTAVITLNYQTPLQLLVAAVLSAQSTDEKVNQITPALFERYRTCEDFAAADPEELHDYIKSIGLYRNKAKFIKNACQKIVTEYNGKVPDTMEELITLPGIARKTANVVLSNAFGTLEGIIVDTHVKRLSQRLGLTKEKTPVKIEQDLMSMVPRKEWLHFANLLLYHGRAVCHAQNPECTMCVIRELCPSRRE